MATTAVFAKDTKPPLTVKIKKPKVPAVSTKVLDRPTPALYPGKGRYSYDVEVTYTETLREIITVHADHEDEAEELALAQFDWMTGSIDDVVIRPTPPPEPEP